jgi:dihydroorotate dehydrogenase
VGNTTKKRPDPLPQGYVLPKSEAKLLLEQGGYSGPQMFERTLALVAKYRKALDEGPKQLAAPAAAAASGAAAGEEATTGAMTSTRVEVEQAQPSAAFDDLSDTAPTVTVHSTPSAAPAPSGPRKVIFATGGITNGRQARQVLDAGASVAQMYTAMIYGGAGTISRVKQEMRDEAKQQQTMTKA